MCEVIKFPERAPRATKGSTELASQMPGAPVTVSSVALATKNLIQRDVK